METNRIYLLPESFAVSELWKSISEIYNLQEAGVEEGQYSCMDTYDWRLFLEGIYLTRKRAVYREENGVGRVLLKGQGSRKNYPFWWDIEEGELRERLRSVMDVRALKEQFVLNRVTERFVLLNRDEKTVLRLSLDTTEAVRNGEDALRLDRVLHVEPLRGYAKPVRTVCALLDESGLAEWDATGSYVADLQVLYGIDPSVTSSKFEVSLGREESVNEVVRDICLQLQQTMVRTLPGVREDIDSEFLHDFRVAIRRTRSLLTLVKKYLPEQEIAHFKDELKWLGSVTGPTRDLDVYLLARDDFRSMLPELLHPGIDAFFNGLEAERKKSIRLLRRNLASEKFALFMKEWEEFLLGLPEKNSNPAGGKNCRKAAGKIIRKRFNRILRDGGRITPESPDKNLHELRIEGKKFRYLLEFFRSLFVSGAVDKYLKQLKRLQNNLGDFNDLSVQREMLSGHMEALTPTAADTVQKAASLGGLIVHLADQQTMVRKKFEKTFDTFASLENIELLESIFGEKVVSRKGDEL